MAWRWYRFLAVAGLLAVVAACAPRPPAISPRYVLGAPYQAGGVWHYPRESHDLDETGLAAIMADRAGLTTNGEPRDQTALIAAHPTLQLPAIARLTDLETGRTVLVRINDRGSGDPRRLLEVSRRTAALLGFPPDGVARVRLRVLAGESRAAAEALPGAPSLAVATAPRGVVEVAELPPPPGARQGSGRSAAAPAAMAAREAAAPVASPLRLPESVTQEAPRPGRLMVRLDTFEDYQYAAMQRARLAGLKPRIVSVYQGRSHQFRVEIGPFDNVRQADAALDQALASGIPDARIVVD